MKWRGEQTAVKMTSIFSIDARLSRRGEESPRSEIPDTKPSMWRSAMIVAMQRFKALMKKNSEQTQVLAGS